MKTDESCFLAPDKFRSRSWIASSQEAHIEETTPLLASVKGLSEFAHLFASERLSGDLLCVFECVAVPASRAGHTIFELRIVRSLYSDFASAAHERFGASDHI